MAYAVDRLNLEVSQERSIASLTKDALASQNVLNIPKESTLLPLSPISVPAALLRACRIQALAGCGNSSCCGARLQAPTANIGKAGTARQARGNASPAMREGARRQSPAGANFEPRQARQAPNGHRQVGGR